MDFFKNIWVWVSGSLVGFLTFGRSLFLYKVRLINQDASLLLDTLLSNGKYFVIREEFAQTRLPHIFAAFCKLNKMRFFLNIEERMLQAGFAGTDSVADVTLFRWNRKKFIAFVGELHKKISNRKEIPVYILQSWDSTKIGELKIPEKLPIPYLVPEYYADVEKDITRTLENEDKLGVLLYGPPGNGKSYFIRYIALKYKLPIYIVSLMREIDNHDLIKMFSNIKGPAMVLLEDFDNFFDRRIPLLDLPKFTFDVFLNVLDGVFSSPKGVIFFMTANDINKIDQSLKARPSRFKYVKEIGDPNDVIRNQIFDFMKGKRGDAVKATQCKSLDVILSIKERMSDGVGLQEALDQCEQYFVEKEEMDKIIAEKSKEDNKKEGNLKKVEAA